ncbi:legumain [Salmo salar]|uniref:Legumain n=1 Tax=Salmo salar TaxID=8030 RepID=A0ABM3CUN2_SALSA|nr:legumain [Salmo salar]
MFTLTLALLGLSLGLVANAFPTQRPENGKNWVVIVAGSNGWHNYRHQADACHAYQIVHRNGIPDEQIVVMMYDDLAANEKQPGPRDVTPDNFLAVLKGDSASTKWGTGKVLKSGPNDHVFVYITAHGAPGLLAFPEDELYAADLMAAINYMHDKKKYKKSVFYIDASGSGSMMTKLSDDIGVYATTATNSTELSNACYYDEKRNTFLGDWYSVNWMENSDVEDISMETLMTQFKIVQSNTSHVMKFGNETLANMKVMAFQGNANARPNLPMTLKPVADPGLTISTDVPLEILKRNSSNTDNSLLRSHVNVRDHLKQKMLKVVTLVTGFESEYQKVLSEKMDLTQHQCYKTAVTSYKKHCSIWHTTVYENYLLDLYLLFNLCGKIYRPECIWATIEKVCTEIDETPL